VEFIYFSPVQPASSTLNGFTGNYFAGGKFMLVRVLAAAVGGGIVFFGLGFVIYGLLLDPYFKANMNVFPGMMREPMPDMLFLCLWNLAMALLFAFVFENWAGIRTLSGGLKGGAILMLILAMITDFQYLAFTNVWKGGPVPVIVDILAATVLGTAAGGAVGLVLGLFNKPAAE
jgi:hypothetical protein